MKKLGAILERFWFSPLPPLPLGVFRFLMFGPATVFVALTSSRFQADGFYEKWDPISFYALWDSPFSTATLETLQFLWIGAGLLAAFGFFYRLSAPLAAFSGLLFLGHSYNFGFVYHSTHLYVMTLLILSFSKADRAFILKPTDPSSHWEYRWPLALVQAYTVWVFFICGLEKLHYGGGLAWAFSDAFWLRLVTLPHQSPTGLWLLTQPAWISQLLAGLALIIVELLSPLALLSPRWGLSYVLIWTGFHIGIVVIFGGHDAFFSQVFVYSAFILGHSQKIPSLFREKIGVFKQQSPDR